MKRFWSYAMALLSRLLDPMEREVVLGDVAELEFVGAHAFVSILGLVLRRQVHPWKQFRSWLVLLAVVVPSSMLLASFCNQLGGELFPVLVMWWNHRVAYATGVEPNAEVFGLLLKVAMLMLGSWSCAFTVGKLARATMHLQTVAFCTMYLRIALGSGPISLWLLRTTVWGWLPVVITCVLVLSPAYGGLRFGAGPSRMGMNRLLALAAGTAAFGVLTTWTLGWDGVAMDNWRRGGPALSLIQLASRGDAWQTVTDNLFSIFVLTSPALLVLAEVSCRRKSGRGMPVG